LSKSPARPASAQAFHEVTLRRCDVVAWNTLTAVLPLEELPDFVAPMLLRSGSTPRRGDWAVESRRLRESISGKRRSGIVRADGAAPDVVVEYHGDPAPWSETR
jgi:hypothetical protein